MQNRREFNGLLLGVLDPAISKGGADRLASYLTQAQAMILRYTRPSDFLDQSSEEGHLNYELNRFGVRLAQDIKAHLRANPADKKLLQFYINVAEACVKKNNEEIAARVLQGIRSAALRDEVDLPPGVYEFPEEEAEIKAVRDQLKETMNAVKAWQNWENYQFHEAAACKDLYKQYMAAGEKFIPGIQALMSMVAIRLENAKNLLLEKDVDPRKKIERLQGIKLEILLELNFIGNILSQYLPEIKKSDSEEFRDFITNNFLPRLGSNKKEVDDLDKKLNTLLKLDHSTKKNKGIMPVSSSSFLSGESEYSTKGKEESGPRRKKSF